MIFSRRARGPPLRLRSIRYFRQKTPQPRHRAVEFLSTVPDLVDEIQIFAAVLLVQGLHQSFEFPEGLVVQLDGLGSGVQHIPAGFSLPLGPELALIEGRLPGTFEDDGPVLLTELRPEGGADQLDLRTRAC